MDSRSRFCISCLLLSMPLTACSPPIAHLHQVPGSLPAYAHNDYKNERPLQDALRLGFSGVEADFFLVDGEILVAHDRNKVRADRTLRSLYLEPLREIIADSGRVCPGGQPFILNIEAKESGDESFQALHDLLMEYRHMLTRVEQGQEKPGPVQVILVGWHPPLEKLAAMPVRCVAVQSYWRDLPPHHAKIPAHLLRLVTAQFPQHFQWQGEDEMPSEFADHLAELLSARDQVPGRLLRIFKVPRRMAIYEALQQGGVDLIGTKKLASSARLLQPNRTP